MPKKANRRAPPRRKAPPPRRPTASSGIATASPESEVNGAVAVAPAPAAQMPASPSVAVQRRGPAPRRPQLAAVSYNYLRHDLRLLGILAPSMVIILVIAYFVFH
ncbi:MAG TPA: hypothetical protein VF898_00650 [Chloroflexota bacterium]